MKFLNLTQFPATKEQAKLGVVDLADNSKLKELLKLDIDTNLEERADEILKLAINEGGLMPGDSVLIAGAPSLMAPLEKRMREGFIIPYYSFSERVSSERVDENGNTIKVSEFKHKKFIEGKLDKDSPVFTLPRYKNEKHSELKIVNLTQHNATEEQMRDGVFEPKNKDDIKKLITFTGDEDLKAVAKEVARIARENGANAAMIGGAPYFMAPLEEALAKEGITPFYAFSEQNQKAVSLEDGTVKKVNEFKYLGLVEAGTKMIITKEIARDERNYEEARLMEDKAKEMGYKEIAIHRNYDQENIGYIFHDEIITEYEYFDEECRPYYHRYTNDGIAYNPKTDNTIPMIWWEHGDYSGYYGTQEELENFVYKDNFICEMGVKEKGSHYADKKALEEAYKMAKERGYESSKFSLTPYWFLEINVSMKKYKEMLEENDPERFDHLSKALDLGVNIKSDYEKYQILDDLEKNNRFKEIYQIKKYELEHIEDVKELLEKSIAAGQWTERELLEEAESYIQDSKKGDKRYWLGRLLALEEYFDCDGWAERNLYEINIKEYGFKEMWVVNRDESGMGFSYEVYDPYTTTEAQFLMTKDELSIVKNDCCFDVWTVRDDKHNVNGLFIGEEGRDCPWNGIFIDKVSDIGIEINYEDEIFSPDDLISSAKNLTRECREINEYYTEMAPTSLIEEDEEEQEL